MFSIISDGGFVPYFRDLFKYIVRVQVFSACPPRLENFTASSKRARLHQGKGQARRGRWLKSWPGVRPSERLSDPERVRLSRPPRPTRGGLPVTWTNCTRTTSSLPSAPHSALPARPNPPRPPHHRRHGADIDMRAQSSLSHPAFLDPFPFAGLAADRPQLTSFS